MTSVKVTVCPLGAADRTNVTLVSILKALWIREGGIKLQNKESEQHRELLTKCSQQKKKNQQSFQ